MGTRISLEGGALHNTRRTSPITPDQNDAGNMAVLMNTNKHRLHYCTIVAALNLLIVSSLASAEQQKTFVLGNSLTAGMSPKRLLPQVAETTSNTWLVNQFTQPGAPLDWHWYVNYVNGANGDKLNSFIEEGTWDSVSLQPFGRPFIDAEAPDLTRANSPDFGVINSASHWIDTFRDNNSDVAIYIYASYPAIGPSDSNPTPAHGSFAEAWDASYTDFTSRDNAFSRSYFEQLVDQLREDKSSERSSINLIPFGDVLYEIDLMASNGEILGTSGIEDWYRDRVHLKWGLPQYAKAATFYASLFGENPENLDWRPYSDIASIDRTDLNDGEKLSMFDAADQASVDLVNEAVWRVVQANSYARVPEPSVGATILACVVYLIYRRTPHTI